MFQLEKGDLLTITTLSIAFFIIASWNLGLKGIPRNTWSIHGQEVVRIDLGTLRNVKELRIYIKNGEINLKVYTGTPENWEKIKEISIYDYSKWKRVWVNRATQFIRLDFIDSHGEISEIAITDEKRVVEIDSVSGEVSENYDLLRLVDEQNKVENSITFMSETVFDEIYFVRAAEDYIVGRKPYEWSHPPLGKLIIAMAILTFGNHPFGWRIGVLIFATLMMTVIYILGKAMMGSWLGASLSTVFLALDFMHFTLGRIATVDTFLVFFSLTSHLFFYIYFRNVLERGWNVSKSPLLFAIIFFALGFSTKWIAFFGLIAQVVVLSTLRFIKFPCFSERQHPAIRGSSIGMILITIGLIAVVATIYLLSFLPYMAQGNTFKDVYQRQWSMLIYHSQLTAVHSFSSPWWSWPFILRPIWLYISEISVSQVSTIVLMGNPAIWWIGIIAIGTLFQNAVKHRDPNSLFLVVFFFLQWIPYALFKRCLFLYHFYSNVPILCLAISNILNNMCHCRREKMYVSAYIIVAVILFILYYPVISGSPVSIFRRDMLRILKGWMF